MEGRQGGSSRDVPRELIRRRTSGGLVGLAVVLAVLALGLSYLGRAVLQPGPFADRAVAALRAPAVQADVADRVSDVIVRSGGGDLIGLRPLVRVVAGAVVGNRAFSALFRRAVLAAHAAVVERGGGRIVMTLADAGVLVQAVLQRFAPPLARRIGAERLSTFLRLQPDSGLLGAVRIARRVYSGAWVLALLALIAAAGAVAISPARQRTAGQLGIGLLASGLAIVVLLALGRAIAEHAAPAGRGAAVGAVWASFLGGLRVQGLWLALAGVICGAAASGRLRSAGQLAQGWRLLIPTVARPQHLLLPALGLIASGVVMILEPAAVLTIAISSSLPPCSQSPEFAGFCGQLGFGWVILEPADPRAKGILERSHRFMRSNFEPGRRFANHLDFQDQFDGWCNRVNQRAHTTSGTTPLSGSIRVHP